MTKTLDEILGLWANSVQDSPDMSVPIITMPEAQQLILQWAADYLIQSPQQIEEMPHQYPVEKEVRHEVANEQRNKLKELGWKG